MSSQELPRYDAGLPAILKAWRGARGTSPHAPRPAGSITVDVPGATADGESVTVPLDEGASRALQLLLLDDIRRQQRAAACVERDAKIVAGIVAAVRAGDDGGDLIAAVVATAATSLFRSTYLTIGRPGSWEAGIVDWMAESGVPVPVDATGERADRVRALAELVADIGHGRDQGFPEDGGDTLSQICGEAANQLGSIGVLAGGGRFAADVDNLACQYASEQARATSVHYSRKELGGG